MNTAEYFPVRGKIIYREEKSYWFSKRIIFQILLEESNNLNDLMKIAANDQLITESPFWRTKRSQPIPPCIHYTATKKDGLFNAEVGDEVELKFRGVMLSIEDYAYKVHHFNSPIGIASANIIA